jgi:hypothetical protein
MSHFGRIFLFTLLYIPSTFCQDASTGAIRGTVSDVSGGRIAGANVVFVNSATGMRYSETTAIDGRFAFELVPPEDYLGRAESTGMSPQITPHLHVDVSNSNCRSLVPRRASRCPASRSS